MDTLPLANYNVQFAGLDGEGINLIGNEIVACLAWCEGDVVLGCEHRDEEAEFHEREVLAYAGVNTCLREAISFFSSPPFVYFSSFSLGKLRRWWGSGRVEG